MPGDNPLIRHWQTELQVFQKNFLLLREQMTAEPIHDLRVAIKKLRSYLRLYAALFKKKNAAKLFEKTKELFSVLGRHRNIEMSRQLLLSFTGKNKEALNPLLIHLQLLQDQIGDYCRRVIQQYEIKEADSATSELTQGLQNFNDEETSGKIKDLFTSSLENIKQNLKHFKNKSHLVRKRLKDIFYWRKIFDSNVFFTKSQLKIIDRVLDLLGTVQDHEVLITNLRYFRKTVLSGAMAEYDLIKKIESRAKKRKERLLERANKTTRELLLRLHKASKRRPAPLVSAPGGS